MKKGQKRKLETDWDMFDRAILNLELLRDEVYEGESADYPNETCQPMAARTRCDDAASYLNQLQSDLYNRPKVFYQFIKIVADDDSWEHEIKTTLSIFKLFEEKNCEELIHGYETFIGRYTYWLRNFAALVHAALDARAYYQWEELLHNFQHKEKDGWNRAKFALEMSHLFQGQPLLCEQFNVHFKTATGYSMAASATDPMDVTLTCLRPEEQAIWQQILAGDDHGELARLTSTLETLAVDVEEEDPFDSLVNGLMSMDISVAKVRDLMQQQAAAASTA